MKVGVLVLMVIFLMSGICYSQSVDTENYNKGIEYAVQGEFEKAKGELEKVFKTNPSDKDIEKKLKVTEDVIGQKIKNETAKHFFKGIAYRDKEEFKKAIAEFTKAINTDPSYVLPYYYRGEICFYTGQNDQVISDLTKVITIDYKDANLYVSRGVAYDEKGQTDLALADLTRAIEIDPKNIHAYNNRGNIYRVTKKQYDEAIFDYTKAIEIDPTYAPAYLQKAWACENANRIKEAIEAYKNFIKYASPQQDLYIENAKQSINRLEKQ